MILRGTLFTVYKSTGFDTSDDISSQRNRSPRSLNDTAKVHLVHVGCVPA